MKKYESVLKRVDFIENKFGIYYAKTDGLLYKSLKFIFSLAFIYSFAINVISIAGTALLISEGDYIADTQNFLIAVSIFAIFSLVGAILVWCKINIIGTALSLVSAPFLLFIFGKELVDTVGIGPFKTSFYWRHAAPLGILIVVALWMFIIAIRAYIKRNKRYKQILKNIYEIFKLENPDSLSHDEWEEFVEKYDPRAFKELED